MLETLYRALLDSELEQKLRLWAAPTMELATVASLGSAKLESGAIARCVT